MTGYWKLKPSEQLDPYKCLEIDADVVIEFITFSIDDRTTLHEWEITHIFNQIREGYVEGQWDSGD